MENKLTISILGCGWYGMALARSLAAHGYNVKGSTTSADKIAVLQDENIEAFLVDFMPDGETFEPGFFDCDILWIAIPPKRKAGEADSYVKKITRIISIAKQHGVKKVVHISSTGVYGDHNSEVNELTPPRPTSESGKALQQVEGLLRSETALMVTIIRFGGLIGPGRIPGRFFGGKKNIPNGQAPVNLIHLEDCLGLSHAILNKQAFGYTFNACSPQHRPKAEFYTKAAEKAGLEKPEFIDELLEWKVVNSVNVKGVLSYTFKVNLL